MHFPATYKTAARRTLDAFTPMRVEAAAWLGVAVPAKALIHLVDGHDQLVAIAAGAPDWAVGVCLANGTIAIRVDRLDSSPETTLRSVLAHEIVHHVLADHGGMPVPRWFEEGLCVVFAGGSFLPRDTRVERLAAMGRLPTLAEAERGFSGSAAEASRAYGIGESAVRHLTAKHGSEAVRRLLRQTRRGVPFPGAFQRATGRNLAAFEEDWRAAVKPTLPWWLFVLWEQFDWALIAFGALLVVFAYIRWRLRREGAMRALGGGEEDAALPS